MKRQIKIIMEYEEEGIDSDTTGPLRMSGIHVYSDDERVSYIQSIKFNVDVNEHFPDLEISFPDFSGYQISDNTLETVKKWKSIFTKILGVKVFTRP